jgi:hypothetical protein
VSSAGFGLCWLAVFVFTVEGADVDWFGPNKPTRRLIEFGWDEPDTSFLRKHQDQFERSVFDGCVFHVNARNGTSASENFAWLCWGRRRFSEAELKLSINELTSIDWKRFRHNFLRFNVTPADLDWFDDHTAVMSNARLAAQLARAGRCQGILLDTEAYQGKLFDYNHQRDARRRPWAEYQSEARARGRELMTAFQGGFPDLTVFVTFGHSLIWKQSEGGKKPLADCKDGLLVPFLDGMIEAAAGNTRIIDGHELSYGYREAGLFAQAREKIKFKAAGLAADRLKYQRVVSAGFGVWLDYDWPKNGWNTAKIDSNYFSPGRFESSLHAAVEQTDEYVWIYSEKPRWWSEGGGALNLPRPYVDVLRRVRSAMGEE